MKRVYQLILAGMLSMLALGVAFGMGNVTPVSADTYANICNSGQPCDGLDPFMGLPTPEPKP